jgi:Ni/Co efflux regulator RcnB
MNTYTVATISILCAALAFPAWSQKGQDKANHGNQDKANHGKEHGNSERSERSGGPSQDNRGMPDQQRSNSQATFVIVDRDRSTVSSYYREEFARGNCPPGLAKKNNGCLPPGQAKKVWVVDQPLAPTVVYYPLPSALYSRLTPPPAGYQYVRIDDDVLLMQTANRSVVNLVVNLR